MIFYITLAISIYSLYLLCKIFKCPKEWEDIPVLPLGSFINFYLSKDSWNNKMENTFQPLFNKYGVARALSLRGWVLVIGDPKLAKEVYTKPDIFNKENRDSYFTNVNVMKLIGKSTVGGVNGQEWKRHRRVMNPIFNKTWSTELFSHSAIELIQGWEKEDGKDIYIQDLIQKMTLDVLGRAIFDIDFKSVTDPNSKLYHLYTSIMNLMTKQPIYIAFPFLEYIPFIKRNELSNRLDQYNEFVESIIKLRKKEMKDSSIPQTDNLINAMIRANEQTEGASLSEEEIRDNAKTFILAGHDTTSSTLTSTLYYLARYPEIQDKLRKEILAAMGDSKELKTPTIDQLKQIPYLDLVIKESMRIMTTFSLIQRITTEKYTMRNGLFIPKKSNILLNLWGIHHNSSTFPNPDQFDPERFSELSSEQSRNWQPFITGPRACIGMNFSILEQRVTLAMILQKFELSISNNNPDYHKLRLNPFVFVHPNDLRIHLKSRF